MNKFKNKGIKEFKLKKYDLAKQNFLKAMEIHPNDKELFFYLGKSEKALKNSIGALECFNTAIKLSSDYTDAYFHRALIKAESKDFKGAIEDYNKIIEVNPRYTKAYNNRGVMKHELEDFEGAIEDYSKAIELNPDYIYAYNNRGNAKNRLGDYKSAVADYNKTIKLDPNYASAYNNRGIVKRNVENYIGAIRDINKAIKLDNESQLYRNNLNMTKEIFEDIKYENSLNPSEYKGFLAFADIMGWKGIWQKKHFNPHEGLKTMLKIKRSILKIETEENLKVNLISDTFIIYSDDLKTINKACVKLIESCLKENLVIRGALAYGEYYNLDTVYVGPAVDEAASWHEKAEEIVIFCTPSAKLEIQENYLNILENNKKSKEKSNNENLAKLNFLERNINTKQGKIESYVINWYTHKNQKEFIKIMKETQVYPELYHKYNNTDMALKELLSNEDITTSELKQ